MDTNFNQIALLLTVITITVLLLVLLVVNLLLGSRNRKLKHQAELQMMEVRQKADAALIRSEVTEATLSDVARDLHDEVGQLLTFSILQLENLSILPTEEKLAALPEIKKSVRESLDSIRSIARGLSIDFITEFGLIDSFKQLLERASKRTSVKTSLYISPGFTINRNVNAVILFRIIRECITNALRHGLASEIQIRIEPVDSNCSISVIDNGSGLVNDRGLHLGLGMKSMHYYASLIQGKLQLENHSTGGTKVCLIFPNTIN